MKRCHSNSSWKNLDIIMSHRRACSLYQFIICWVNICVWNSIESEDTIIVARTYSWKRANLAAIKTAIKCEENRAASSVAGNSAASKCAKILAFYSFIAIICVCCAHLAEIRAEYSPGAPDCTKLFIIILPDYSLVIFASHASMSLNYFAIIYMQNVRIV